MYTLCTIVGTLHKTVSTQFSHSPFTIVAISMALYTTAFSTHPEWLPTLHNFCTLLTTFSHFLVKTHLLPYNNLPSYTCLSPNTCPTLVFPSQHLPLLPILCPTLASPFLHSPPSLYLSLHLFITTLISPS